MSQALLGGLQMANFEIDNVAAGSKEAAVEAVRRGTSSVLVVIPPGFGDSLSKFEPKEIETYAFLRTLSLIGIRKSEILRGVISAMNGYLSDNFLKAKIPDIDPKALKTPIKSRDFIIIKNRQAEGSAAAIAGFVSSQSVFIPVILMMIIIYSSQMVISAIAMEKQNKTLETLLTVPISRTSIVTAKMLSSGIVGLISAFFYMVGYRYFFAGFTSDLGSSPAIKGVADKLGLSMNGNGLLVLGASLFLAILCALALATILGVLAEDFRSAQSLIMPVILLVMIPYFLTLFSDIQSLGLPAKILLLAIPFSHSFLAVQNMFLGNTKAVLFGMLYMLVFFGVLVVLAGKIFSSDKVLTMKLRWGKKKVVL